MIYTPENTSFTNYWLSVYAPLKKLFHSETFVSYTSIFEIL